MIKIIKPAEFTTYVATCPQCGCRFTFNKGDTQYFSSYGNAEIICPQPECKFTMFINLVAYKGENLGADTD